MQEKEKLKKEEKIKQKEYNDAIHLENIRQQVRKKNFKL